MSEYRQAAQLRQQPDRHYFSLREISPAHWVAADPCCISEDDWQTLKAKEGTANLANQANL